MELNELKIILSHEEKFKDINKWKFKEITHGTVSRHKYIVPRIIYPNLLKKNVLVQQCVSGKHLKSKKAIDIKLVREFAKFQNGLNKEEIINKINKFSGCNSTVIDESDFFRKGIYSNFDYDKDLFILKKFKLPIVDKFIKLLNYIRKDKENIIDDFCKMPFARQHHDFKEDNIICNPQKLVDWGSSYGHGPFLFDLAPFLVNN